MTPDVIFNTERFGSRDFSGKYLGRCAECENEIFDYMLHSEDREHIFCDEVCFKHFYGYTEE